MEGPLMQSRILIPAAALFLIAVGHLSGRTIQTPSHDTPDIAAAFLRARAGDTVLVGPGVYREKVFVKHGTVLKGASAASTVIDGGGKGTVVTLGGASVLSHVTVRNGTVGVFSRHDGCAVHDCRIVTNRQSGIVCVRHLPSLSNNAIVFNRASGIQCWDVKGGETKVEHNVIAYNHNHGLAAGGKSSFMVHANIIAHNVCLGVKLIQGAAEGVTVQNNNFYGNMDRPERMPAVNYSFDPEFVSPRRSLDFTPESRCGECPTIPGPKGSDGAVLDSSYRLPGDSYE
jgi:hypothetical protein